MYTSFYNHLENQRHYIKLLLNHFCWQILKYHYIGQNSLYFTMKKDKEKDGKAPLCGRNDQQGKMLYRFKEKND